MKTKTKRLIEEFEEAVHADAWKGSQHPHDAEQIEEDLKRIRTELIQYLEKGGL